MSAVANVAINVDSRGAPAKLKQVADRSKQVEKAVQDMNGDLRRSQREFKGAGNAANQAASGFGKLGKAIGGIVTAAAAFQALKFTIVSTAELETQTRSLKVLTGSLETAQKIVQQLQDIGAVTPFTSTELIDTAKRLRAFGVETEKLVDTTRRLGDVAGATGADLSGIATAFGQIQAKGRLQGEELLQLQERGIDLQSELQRMYGLTGEEFRKALEKGRFSAEAVDVALQNLTNTGGKYANGAIAQSDTLAGKFSTLQDGITRTAQAIGQVLSPALQTILDQAIGVVNSINNALSAGRRIQQFGIDAQQRNELFRQAGEEAEEIARLRGGGRIDPAVFTQLRDERFRDLIERYGYETGQIQIETQAPTLEAPKIPELLGGGGAGATTKTASAGTKAAAKVKETDAQRAAKIKEIRAIERDIFEARRAGNEVLAAQLEAFKSQVEIQQRGLGVEEENQLLLQNGERLNERLKKIDDQRLERLSRFLQGTKELIQAQNDIVSSYQEETRLLELRAQKGEEFVQKFKDVNRLVMEGGLSFSEAFSQIEGRTAAMASLNQEADLFQQSLQGAGDIIGNQLRGAIDGLIDGTADWNDILQSTLKQLGSFLINFGLNALAGPVGSGGILSFLGFGTRANGGPVNANEPYIVGERGPELFMPNQSGAVVNNNQLSSAMNRYRRSGTTATNESAAAMQGGESGTAVLDKPIDVRYTVERINNVDYVTAEQFQQGMMQAAQQGATRGEQQTLKRLRMSRTARKQIGL